LPDTLCDLPGQLLNFARALLSMESLLLFFAVRPLTSRFFQLALSLTLKRASRSLGVAPAVLGFALHLYPNASACHTVGSSFVAALYGSATRS
jgi:hypothetical protein